MKEGTTSATSPATSRSPANRGSPSSSWTAAAAGRRSVLLPCLTLMMMEDAINATKRDIPFHVSGTVTEYKGKNYLMLEQVTRGGRVLQGPLPPMTTDRKSGDGAVKPNAPAVNLLREGTYLVDRRRPPLRAPDGKRSSSPSTLTAGPCTTRRLILLPGQKLAALENASAAADTRDHRYRVSGPSPNTAAVTTSSPTR